MPPHPHKNAKGKANHLDQQTEDDGQCHIVLVAAFIADDIRPCAYAILSTSLFGTAIYQYIDDNNLLEILQHTLRNRQIDKRKQQQHGPYYGMDLIYACTFPLW